MMFPPLRDIRPPYMALSDAFTINTFSAECLGSAILGLTNNAMASAAWTANRLIFLPFVTTERLLVSQFYWVNRATVNGSSDAGIYTEDGQTKVGSTGSTLNSGANALQVVNVTDFYLAANRRYWLALGSDSGTHTYIANSIVVTGMDFLGIKEQLSGWSSGLPSTITVATPTIAVTPMFGFTAKSVI